MQRIAKVFSFILFVLVPFGIQARTFNFIDKTDIAQHLDKNLWFAGNNAAGISFSSLSDYNIVNSDFKYKNGDFSLMQEGKNSSVVSFDTQGAIKKGKFSLWGLFNYKLENINKSYFNTLLFNPFDERLLYNVADTVESTWNRQCYQMTFKASAPLMEDKLSLGMQVSYSDRIASKQNDPRAESYSYILDVKPSFVLKLGKIKIGGYALYSHLLERTAPTLSNGSEIQRVYMLRGLGNFINEIVGQSGLRTMYYFINSFGGGVQFAFNAPSVQMICDIGAVVNNSITRHGAINPRMIGNVAVFEYYTSFDFLYGKRFNNKISLRVNRHSSYGTEYTTIIDKDSGNWNIVSDAVMSTYEKTSVMLLWRKYIMHGDTRRWLLETNILWKDKRDRYLLPKSWLFYDNLKFTSIVKRHFNAGGSSLDLGGIFSLRKNILGEYVYSGSKSSSPPVRNWYTHDTKVLTSDYIRCGIDVDWTFPIKNAINFSIHSDVGTMYALCNRGMYIFDASCGISIIF